MHRWRRVALLLLAPALAHAEGTEVGAFVGPRFFASDALLGYLPDAPAHPSLGSSVMFGGRIAHPLFEFLVPELELAMSPTSTSAVGGAESASVFWIEPRLHMRFQFRTGERLQPFAMVGGGSPIALSSARQTFDSGIVAAGYAGGGLKFDTTKGFLIRFDARVAFVPGKKWIDNNDEGSFIRAEVDVGIGIELQLGRKRRALTTEATVARTDDDDKDGIANAKDTCPKRAEDQDGFDDLDGCPDIDNDADRVLDIADNCATVPESYNGFADDDGCPDTVPPDVDALRGTIEGLLYAEAETAVRKSAIANIQKIAKTMTAHPSIRVVLVGHTDDREAKQFATSPDQDMAELATDLARARAEAVRQVLVANGIAEGRVVIEGRGAEEPISENDKPKGRLGNRRVEIELFVAPAPR